VGKYKKEKLDDISGQLEIFLYSLKGFKVWKSGKVDKYKY